MRPCVNPILQICNGPVALLLTRSRGNVAGERERVETWTLVWAFVGLHQWVQVKSPHTAAILLLSFLRHALWLATRTVNSDWPACACHPSKAVTLVHIFLWPGRDVTHYHAHAKRRALSAAHPTTTPTPPPSDCLHLHPPLCYCSILRWPLPERGQNVPFTRAAGQSK